MPYLFTFYSQYYGSAANDDAGAAGAGAGGEVSKWQEPQKITEIIRYGKGTMPGASPVFISMGSLARMVCQYDIPLQFHFRWN